MKKLTNSKQMSKIAKTTLAIVLAGSFSFSATNAFAEGTAAADTAQTVSSQADASGAVNAEQSTQTQEAPALLPGDFFYFAKIAFEKIQLALTFDDVKEAKLLADFSKERLAEAESLFASGDQDGALKTLKAALENMDNANKMVDGQQPVEVNAANNQADDELSGDSQQAGDETAANDQKADDEAAAKDPKADDSTEVKEVKDVKDVKDVLSHNIVALTAAMEKVKNPKAKAALQRNIEKAKAKLAKKQEKMAKKKERKLKDHDASSVDNTNAMEDKTDETSTEAVTATEPSADQQAGISKQPKADHDGQINQKVAPKDFEDAKAEVKQRHKEDKEQEKQKKHEMKEYKHEGKEHNQADKGDREGREGNHK